MIDVDNDFGFRLTSNICLDGLKEPIRFSVATWDNLGGTAPHHE